MCLKKLLTLSKMSCCVSEMDTTVLIFFQSCSKLHSASPFHGPAFSASYFLPPPPPTQPQCEILADCYAKQFCVSVWLGRQLLVLMRSASITVFLLIETHRGSRIFQFRQWCVVRECHFVSWKYMLWCFLRQDKWVLLGFGRVWSFSGEW